MFEKFKTLLWFLKQPKLYPQLGYLIKSRVLDHNVEKERELAKRWCRENALSAEEAFSSVTSKQMTYVHQIFDSEFKEADKRAKECPVLMGGTGDIDLLYNLAEHVQANRVIETGVAYGWSSLAILLSLKNRPGTKLISSDMPYAKVGNEDHVGCVVADELREYWKLIRLPDRQALPKALSELGEIDLCHYDSDKSYRGKKWAYPLLWNALRKGGIFVSDDIGDDFAFRDFSTQIAKKPVVIRSYADKDVEKYVGVFIN